MKNRFVLLLSGLLIGLAFSVLLVRVASLERENARQQEQIILLRQSVTQAQDKSGYLKWREESNRCEEQIVLMRESATQAREAFDSMERYRLLIKPGMDDEWATLHISRSHAEFEVNAYSHDLDADIKTLERISKER